MQHRRPPGVASATIDSHDERAAPRPVTCARDGREHIVSEHTMTRENAGRYVAWCGHRVLAAALACPPGRPCPDCFAIDRARAEAERRRRQAEMSIWARLAARLHC